MNTTRSKHHLFKYIATIHGITTTFTSFIKVEHYHHCSTIMHYDGYVFCILKIPSIKKMKNNRDSVKTIDMIGMACNFNFQSYLPLLH